MIDTIRILPQDEEGVDQPTLGIEEGGLHCAEAMQLARFFMFSQVYFHRVRRIYDFHLKQFMRCYLSDGQYPEEPNNILKYDDNGILTAISRAGECPTVNAHEPARRIISREHFRLVYSPTPRHKKSLMPGQQIYEALKDDFEQDLLHHDTNDEEDAEGATIPDFPVLKSDGSIISAAAGSDMLRSISDASYDYVFADPLIVDEVQEWLDENKKDLLAEKEGEC